MVDNEEARVGIGTHCFIFLSLTVTLIQAWWSVSVQSKADGDFFQRYFLTPSLVSMEGFCQYLGIRF